MAASVSTSSAVTFYPPKAKAKATEKAKPPRTFPAALRGNPDEEGKKGKAEEAEKNKGKSEGKKADKGEGKAKGKDKGKGKKGKDKGKDKGKGKGKKGLEKGKK